MPASSIKPTYCLVGESEQKQSSIRWSVVGSECSQRAEIPKRIPVTSSSEVHYNGIRSFSSNWADPGPVDTSEL